MIKHYRDEYTKDLFNGGPGHTNWEAFTKAARIRLLILHAATSLRDLKNCPRSELKPLDEDHSGKHLISVNDQYKVCFVWQNGHAYSVGIVDCYD